MQIDVGYFYFIKDSFFDIMDAPEFKSVMKKNFIQSFYKIEFASDL